MEITVNVRTERLEFALEGLRNPANVALLREPWEQSRQGEVAQLELPAQ